MGASDFGRERKDVDGWWWLMENHVPHADEHKLDVALFLDFFHECTKIIHSDQKSTVSFQPCWCQSWKVNSSAPYYGNPQNGAAGSDYSN